ncbi:MAG: hypothetical protein FWF56_03480 [Firmicutes bacterium]|nr:hypothetical protein [Bacillota bacterium]
MPAPQPKKYPKDKKVDIYYYKDTPSGRVKVHLCSQRLLWAFVRDSSMSEKTSYEYNEIGNIQIVAIMNYNPSLLKLFDSGNKSILPTYLAFNNRTYAIADKPDEYDYTQGDMRVLGREIVDIENKNYVVEQWQE